jgi:hypothetical protein
LGAWGNFGIGQIQMLDRRRKSQSGTGDIDGFTLIPVIELYTSNMAHPLLKFLPWEHGTFDLIRLERPKI